MADAGAGEEDEWEDEGGWEDESPHKERGRSWKDLPNDWVVNVKEDAGVYRVIYTSPDGAVLRNKGEVCEYLSRKEMDPDIVEVTDFSQRFARLVYKGGAAQSGGPAKDNESNPGPDSVHTGGSPSAEGGAQTEEEDRPFVDTSNDEELARRMQEQFDRESMGFVGGDAGSDDGSGYTLDSSSDEIGEVAAGGWRMRELEAQEDKAGDDDINSMEVQTLESDLEGHCPVCQDDWKQGQQVRVLPCDHRFHVGCIDKWLRDHNARCPLCKKDVREDWEDEEEEVWDPLAGRWISSSGGASSAGAGEAGDDAEDDGEGEGSSGSWETASGESGSDS